MHFFRMWPIFPLLPSLVVFGLGMASLYFGKRESSSCLKTGGFVMSIGSLLIMIFLLMSLFKTHPAPMCMGDQINPMGPKCPMMQGKCMMGEHNKK